MKALNLQLYDVFFLSRSRLGYLVLVFLKNSAQSVPRFFQHLYIVSVLVLKLCNSACHRGKSAFQILIDGS